MVDPLVQRCKDCVVRDTSLCASLCDDELVALSAIGRRKTVPKGGVIAWAGDENAMCANVVNGALKVLASTADGREQAVGLLFSGDFVGAPFTATNQLTTVALTETDLCFYPRPAFERVLADRPKLERALLERTIRSLNEARERQLTLARRGAQARIAGLLMDMLRTSSGPIIELPMSRGDIADYLGLTIETVSRQFTELKARGVIAADRGGRTVTVLSRDELQSLSEE